MAAEIADSSNLATCMALTGVGWQVGTTLAPTLGGIFAQPATTWPGIFRGTIFEVYPYALSCIVVTVIPAIAVILAVYYSEETHLEMRSGRRKRPGFETKGSDGYEMVSQSSDASPRVSTSPNTPVVPMPELNTVLPLSQKKPGLFSCGGGFLMTIWVSKMNVSHQYDLC